MDTDPLNDDTVCNPPILDSTLFPVGTAALDPNFDILPFLCNLMKVATNENIDPVLVPPPDYDLSKHLNFTALTAVGDPRFSTGDVMKAGLVNFLPRIITQLEVRAAGGTQVIDNYICDSDGNPIKQSNTIPVMTSVGNGGVNLFGYDIPTGLDQAELVKTVTQDEVNQFVNDFITQQTQDAADYFIQYLMLYYPATQWTATLHQFKLPPFFYVLLTSKTSDKYVYLKYWPNASEYVANQLSSLGYIASASITQDLSNTFNDNAMVRAWMQPIPDYEKLMNNTDDAKSNFDNALSTLSASTQNRYDTLNSLLAQGAVSQSAFQLVSRH